MKIEHNCDLKKFTTLRIGGICNTMYFPESVEELLELRSKLHDVPILGGGSNLLINDKRSFQDVICMRDFMKNILKIDENEVRVGAGVRLQKLISIINENGLGGIEYLFSVPGLVGGAIYMNAGRGRGANKQISDYLVSVEVLEDGNIRTYLKDECEFGYRTSIFQKKNCVIISATFIFDKINPDEGKRLQNERIKLCKEFQDNQYPNAGTTFCEADLRIMRLCQKLSNKKATRGVHFSTKTTNWLQNRGNGTYKQAMRKIRCIKTLHKIFHQQCVLEYIVWN